MPLSTLSHKLTRILGINFGVMTLEGVAGLVGGELPGDRRPLVVALLRPGEHFFPQALVVADAAVRALARQKREVKFNHV